MLLSILLSLFIFAAVIFAVFLFAPIRLSCSGSYSESSQHAVFFVCWFHPNVLRCDINGKTKSFSLVALGRFRLFSSEEEKVPENPPGSSSSSTERFPDEKPVIEKSTPAGGREETYSHKSPQPDAGAEKSREKPKEKPVDKEKKEKPGEETGGETRRMFGFLQRPAVKRVRIFISDANWRNKIFRWLQASVVRFFHIVSVTCFRLHVKLGFSDPSDAGKAFGYYIAAKNALMDTGGRRSHTEIIFEPVFDREMIEADGRLEISSSIARLCLPVVLAVLTFPVLHTLILYWKARRIGKKQKIPAD
jgi:hypothetical protein